LFSNFWFTSLSIQFVCKHIFVWLHFPYNLFQTFALLCVPYNLFLKWFYWLIQHGQGFCHSSVSICKLCLTSLSIIIVLPEFALHTICFHTFVLHCFPYTAARVEDAMTVTCEDGYFSVDIDFTFLNVRL
jgi:hypothetical protein